jgi:hypothetical protein
VIRILSAIVPAFDVENLILPVGSVMGFVSLHEEMIAVRFSVLWPR